MKTKETKINWNANGKEVSVTIIRRHGRRGVTYNLDGDKCEATEMVDDYTFEVIAAGKRLENPVVIDYEGGKAIYGCVYIKERKTRINVTVRMTDEVAAQIEAAKAERLTDDMSDDERKQIQAAKAAEAEGRVLPLSELKRKRRAYNAAFNDGGEGYNPYANYISEEWLDELKKKYKF